MRCLFSDQLKINSFSFDPSARPRATRLHDSQLPEYLPSLPKVHAKLATVKRNTLLVVSKSRCPLLLAHDVSACICFLFSSKRDNRVVVGTVGKWESRVLCGIPKRRANPVF